MRVYLDYNATTPLDPAVERAMRPYQKGVYGNASSLHAEGRLARAAIESARQTVASAMRVESQDIIFTSGGTESDNLALLGAARRCDPKRRRVIVSAIEHPAVLESARYLKEEGYEIVIAPAGSGGVVEVGFIREHAGPSTALISLMHVNNELGTLQPVEAVGEIARRCGALFHVDAVQSFGKIPVLPGRMGADLLSVSSHKLCGPKGAGALYVKKGTPLKPLFFGGHQERRLRPGTEAVSIIVGFGHAVRLASEKSINEVERVGRLRNRLERGLVERIDGIVVNGSGQTRIFNTLNVSFERVDAEALMIRLDLEGLEVSSGSACTAGSLDPSHVLTAIGLPELLAASAVRYSLGRFTTAGDIATAIAATASVVKKIRKSIRRR
ncbi:MAG: cysteine desulfurase family protein [Candidatus Omnitrophota bacterium]